ncbi:hypothetical protein QQ045_025561 [Rhodiola kirilowii]
MERSGEVLRSDFLAVGSSSNHAQQHLKRKRSSRANDRNPAESRTNQVQQRTERKGTRGDDKNSTKIANALNSNPQNEDDHIIDTAADCPIKRKYKGVSRSSTKFTAHFWLPMSTTNEKGRQVYIGSYDSLEKAARVHDLGALKYLGPKTELNFPVEDYSEEIEHMKQFSEEVYKDMLHRESSGFCRGNSNYRGVFFQKGPGNWQARVHDVSEGKYLYVGTFDTKEEAAKAYDQAVLKLEKNQVTNFPRSNYEDFLQPSTTGNPDEVVQHLEETESQESDFQLLETYPTVTYVEEQPLCQLESILGQSQPGLFGEQCQNTDQELEELVITACAFSPGFLMDSIQPAPDLVNQDNVGISSLLPMPTVNDDGHLYCQWQEPEALIMTPHASCPGLLMDLVQPAQDMTFDDNIEISWFNEEMSAELPIPSVPDQSNGLLHIPDGYACNLDSQGYLIFDESRAQERSENAANGPSSSTLSELLPFEDLEAFLLDDDYQSDLASPQRQIPLAHLPQNVENSRLPDPQNMTFDDNVDISWFNEEMSGELAIPSVQDQCNRLPKFPERYTCSRDSRGYQIIDIDDSRDSRGYQIIDIDDSRGYQIIDIDDSRPQERVMCRDS